MIHPRYFHDDFNPLLLKTLPHLVEAYMLGFDAGRWNRPCEAPFRMTPQLRQLVDDGEADLAMTVRIHQQIMLEWYVGYADAHHQVRRNAWMRALKAQDVENGLAA